MWLQALVLCAFLARVALPAFHFHDEEGGRGGECHHHHATEREATGPAAAEAKPACSVCEVLATKVPGLAPEPPPEVASSPLGAPAPGRLVPAAPRSAEFRLVGSPRGPPPSPLA